MSNYPEKVYLNNEILDCKNAKVSVFDRGFLFGDGIYEVMAKVNGRFFHGKKHLDRLAECLRKIHIDFDMVTLPDKINELLKASDLDKEDCLIYIQVTRGVAPRKHSFPVDIQPTFMMYASPFKLPEINKNNIRISTLTDYRWHRCDIKMISLLGNVMANNQAFKQEAHEAVFVRNGSITEGSHSNIFFVKDRIVYTHPANEHILNGITRQITIQLCKDLDIEIKEEAILKKDIIYMDEAFLTGTTTQVASIKKIDDYQFYTHDNTGFITRKLQEAFLTLKR
jgi:D-alanine transaminase